MKSFVQQGLKPEQRFNHENLKLVWRRRIIFHLLQGKTHAMPHVCISKKRNLPLKLRIRWDPRVVLSLLWLQQEPTKRLQSKPGILRRNKIQNEKDLRKRLSNFCAKLFFRFWSIRTPTPLELNTRFLLNFFDFACESGENQPSS